MRKIFWIIGYCHSDLRLPVILILGLLSFRAAARNLVQSVFPVLLSYCHSERPPVVILSVSEESVPKTVRNGIPDKEPVRRDVAGLMPLRTDDAIQSIY